ncbi:MAG: transcriptional regulator [Nannocystaceae bacterium]|nr:transcriptional regulator [Nannocystaceae bacterium]
MITDLLYQLAGSAMAEREIAEELRTDQPTLEQCLRQLGALEIVQGPQGEQRLWTAVPEDAPFDVVVAKAKSARIDVRQSIAKFVETHAA